MPRIADGVGWRLSYRRFDANGDGFLSLDEFGRMLGAMSSSELSSAQVEQMYNSLMALGDGTIKPEDLQQMLYLTTERRRAEAAQQSGLDIIEDDHEAHLARLARTWESVRHAVSLEQDVERWSHYSSPECLMLIIKIQARFRGLVLRARKAAGEMEEQMMTAEMKRALLSGDRMARHPGAPAASEVVEGSGAEATSWRAEPN